MEAIINVIQSKENMVCRHKLYSHKASTYQKKKKTNIQSNKELHRETLDICIKFICTSPFNLC